MFLLELRYRLGWQEIQKKNIAEVWVGLEGACIEPWEGEGALV